MPYWHQTSQTERHWKGAMHYGKQVGWVHLKFCFKDTVLFCFVLFVFLFGFFFFFWFFYWALSQVAYEARTHYPQPLPPLYVCVCMCVCVCVCMCVCVYVCVCAVFLGLNLPLSRLGSLPWLLTFQSLGYIMLSWKGFSKSLWQLPLLPHINQHQYTSC